MNQQSNITTPLALTDSYKLSHRGFMNPGTSVIYSNLTPRSGKYFPVNHKHWDKTVVVWGLRAVIQELLIDYFNENFFERPRDEAVTLFVDEMNQYLGEGAITREHFDELWDLDYLPIEIYSVPEGSRVEIGTPVMIIKNTHPNFAWLTNYLETVLSAELWHPMTVATLIREFRLRVNYYAMLTTGSTDGTEFQLHDFSFRGHTCRQAATRSGAAFLLSSCGTDTVPAIGYLKNFYDAGQDGELIGTSVPASEHSLASLGIAVEGELETYRRWITECYPTGIVSVISDTLDFFKVITEMVPKLKDDILSRKPNALGLAKVVFRPDSGDPVHIITGYTTDPSEEFISYDDFYQHYANTLAVPEAVRIDGQWWKTCVNAESEAELDGKLSESEVKGAVQCLWEIFGGTETPQGYKVLHERVGLIYGDSITLERLEKIMSRLEKMGFASTNCIFGIGSYTTQMLTRDSLGFAVKATAAEVNGEDVHLFKDPVTDDGTKRSARGGIALVHVDGDLYTSEDGEPLDVNSCDDSQLVFKDGMEYYLSDVDSFTAIRNRLWGNVSN